MLTLRPVLIYGSIMLPVYVMFRGSPLTSWVTRCLSNGIRVIMVSMRLRATVMNISVIVVLCDRWWCLRWLISGLLS